MPKSSYTVTPGQRFGRLVVQGRSVDNRHWRCLCDCGKQTDVLGYSLNKGRTHSCGCYRREYVTNSNTTHGKTKSPTYRSWTAMWARCANPARKAWAEYGMRGIKVCDEWKSFDRFLKDMGERPVGYSLERKDNAAGYFPGNCYWADRTTQAWNRRSTVWLEYGNRRMPRSAWARELGISDGVLTRRLKKFPIAIALSKEKNV